MSDFNQKSTIKTALFLGSKALGLRVLRSIVEAAPDVRWTILHGDDQTDARSIIDEFRAFATDKQIQFLVVKNANETKREIAIHKPDIAFACGWYWLLDKTTLDLVPEGIFGMHNSLLPRYRGSAPLVWAIMNGETEVGISLFQFNEGMDDGGIAGLFPVPISADETIGDVLTKLENKCVTDLPQIWRSLLDGTAQLMMQDESQVTYCGARTPEDGLINWHQSATQIHNFIRAQAPPYPGAFTMLGDQKIILLKSQVFEHPYMGTPGQVLMRGHPEIIISCGENTALIVDEIQVDGSHSAPTPRQIFNSIHLRL